MAVFINFISTNHMYIRLMYFGVLIFLGIITWIVSEFCIVPSAMAIIIWAAIAIVLSVIMIIIDFATGVPFC